MRCEIARQHIAQRHGGTEPDEDRAEATTYVLRKVARATTEPSHIKTGHARGGSRQHIDAPIPTMENRKAASDLWNQLNRPRQHDDDGRSKMHGNGEITHPIARDVTVSDELAPRTVIAANSCHTVERGDSKRKQ